MSTSKPSTDSFSDETMARCRKCLSTDGALEPVTFDERGEYLLQQVFSCTNVQMELLPNIPTYLCSACKTQLNFLDKRRSIWVQNNAKIKRLKEELDTTHLTGSETTVEHSGGGMQQSDAVESVVKTEVATEDSEEDYHHDDFFEAEEVSLKTLLKREPMDDQQQLQSSDAELKHEHNIVKPEPFDVEGEASVAGKTTMGPDDPAAVSDHNNLGAAEGPTFEQMDPNGEEKSKHTDNQRVSVVGERRLLRSSKRRSSQKDIAAAKFSVSTMQSPKVTRNVHKNKQKHQCTTTEGRTLNQMDTNGAEKSRHTGNQPVSIVGEQRLLRSNKRRSSQKDIAAAKFSVSTIQSPKVTRNVHKNKQKHQCTTIEGRTLNQMDTNGAEKSRHTGNQPVSIVGEQRLLRSNKRRSSQKDIAAAKFSVSTIQSPKVTRNVHKNKQKHQCPRCSKTYPNTSRLKIHIRTHTGEKPFICKVCSKAFHAANYLFHHMQIHNKDLHQCHHCPGTFSQQSFLDDHIRTHTGEKPFMCQVCDKAFHTARILRCHMKIHNKDQNKCPHCPAKFAEQYLLNDHIRTHTGENPFMCQVCDKAFHAARILRSHMKIHNKDQNKCPHCPGKFAKQYQLTDHIRKHTGEMPFVCKVCGKAFHAAKNLAIHMKIHNKDKQCPHCPGKFAQQSRLNDHIRTHTGENPFMCKVCGNAFHAAGILRFHMKIHNKDQH